MSFWWFWAQPPVVEEALDEDLPKIADIHAASFPNKWNSEELARMKAQEGVAILVARRASPYGTRAPLGFLILRTVADEAEVITIAVHPRQRGRGIGKKLMEAGLFRLYGERCSHLFFGSGRGEQCRIAALSQPRLQAGWPEKRLLQREWR